MSDCTFNNWIHLRACTAVNIEPQQRASFAVFFTNQTFFTHLCYAKTFKKIADKLVQQLSQTTKTMFIVIGSGTM